MGFKLVYIVFYCLYIGCFCLFGWCLLCVLYGVGVIVWLLLWLNGIMVLNLLGLVLW